MTNWGLLMKKSKMVACAFSMFVELISNAAYSETVALDGSVGAFDYHRLKAAVERRPEFVDWDGVQSFRVEFDNKNVYFLTSSVMLSKSKKPVTHGYPGGRGWCEFDFFDENYNYVNGIRVSIVDHESTNVCNWIHGISAVTYKGEPALLAAVQYHRGIDPAKSIGEIGRGYHDFTALLIVKANPDGSLSIRQDDNCLGPMNQIGELAIARKRINECNH